MSEGVAMYINWTTDVFIDPVTLIASAGPSGIPVPTYGNYGGPDYSNGTVGGTIPTSGGVAPRDNLDALFKVHDFAYQTLLQPLAKELPLADIALIHGIESLTGHLDAEASLYGGAAILGIAAFMAGNGHPLSPLEAFVATSIAAYDIQFGLNHLSSTERAMAAVAVQDIVAAFGHSAIQVVGTTAPDHHGFLI
jgi:hypothetical protein